jgi:predicted neuraminidase
MTRYRPARLANGGLLLPLYNECLAVPMFMKSMDDFATWEEMQYDMGDYFFEHVSFIQPTLITRSDGSIMALLRNGTESRRIGRMVSANNAKSWTKVELTELPNSGTAVEQVKLLDGHVAVIFNNNPNDRFPLNAALSVDEGVTFTAALRTLNSDCPVPGTCSYGYPSITQSLKDGSLWATYTHNRETIGWVHFNEAWLMQGHEPINIGK